MRIHQRPLLLLLLFLFYFLPLISTFPLPCAAPDLKNVETFPRQGACFTLSYAYVCVRTLIKDNNKKLWSVCVCVCVGDCEGCGCVDWEWGEAGFGFKANEPLMFLQ